MRRPAGPCVLFHVLVLGVRVGESFSWVGVLAVTPALRRRVQERTLVSQFQRDFRNRPLEFWDGASAVAQPTS